MKKIRKRTLVILIVLAALIGGVCALTYWQWNNIMALKYATYTEEEQAQLTKENEEVLKKISEQLQIEDISALSDEAVEMFNKGELTEQEAVEIITGKTTLEQIKIEKEENKGNTQGNEEPKEANVSNLVAKLYVLRSSFVGRLNSLLSQAKAEYANGGNKGAILAKYAGIAGGLEASCDAQVESLLSQIKAELERTGGDTSIVGKIRSAYRSEKSAKKAAILSQYH